MQRFRRETVQPPRALRSKGFSNARNKLISFFLSDSRKMAQTRTKSLMLDLEHSSIRESLANLFHEKCSFCESVESTVSYRYRPGGGVINQGYNSNAHLYYSWLANSWENIYSICQGCLPARIEYFPVVGERASLPTIEQLQKYVDRDDGRWGEYTKEDNLLLDPCENINFSSHFHVRLDGKLVALTDNARETIVHFNLNRPELVLRRKKCFYTYLHDLFGFVLPSVRSGGLMFDPLFDFKKLEFGGLWYLLCRRVILDIKPLRARYLSLSIERVRSTLELLCGLNDFDKRILGIEDRLVREDVEIYSRLPERVTSHFRMSLAPVSFEFKNYKGIEHLNLQIPDVSKGPDSSSVPSRPSLLILGENATGKSSILEAISLALCTEEARRSLPIKLDAIPLNREYMGLPPKRSSENSIVTITFRDFSQRILSISKEDCHVSGVPEVPPVFAYGAFRQYQDLVLPFSPERSIINLFKSEQLLSNPEAWLLDLSDARFDMVIRALRDIFSIEGDFEVVERDRYRSRCLIVTKSLSGAVISRTPLSLASSGYRSILAMVCDIMQGLMDSRVNPYFDDLETAQAVVLIDEVEAHLHPRWKIQIMQALRKALPEVTFIVTSHDPLCLRGMHSGEVIVMHRVAGEGGSGAGLPVRVEQLQHLPDVSRLTIEQLLTSDFFNLQSTDQPETTWQLAEVTDILARIKSGSDLSDREGQVLADFENEVNEALPVGFSEAQRLVQEAVVEFLNKRREISSERLVSLREASRLRILSILEGI